MRTFLLFFGWVVAIGQLGAQTVHFSKIYGTTFCDAPAAVVNTTQGGYAMGGFTTAHEQQGNFLLVVTDANGDTLLTREYDSGGMDIMMDMKRTDDGGYIMVGYTFIPSMNMLVIKTDAIGTVMWSKSYSITSDYEIPSEVIQTSDGGYAIAGYDDTCGFIMKLDTTGAVQWWNRFSSVAGNGSRMFAIAENSNGDLIAAGVLFVSNSQKALLTSVSSAGNLNWSRSISGSDNYWPSSIVLHSSGSIFVGGTSNLYSSGAEQMFLMKFNNAGALQYTNHYNIIQFPSSGGSIVEVPGGNLCMVGSCSSPPYNFAVAFLIDQAGVATAAYEYYPANYYSGFVDVIIATDGGLAMLAAPDSAFGNPDSASFNLVKMGADVVSYCGTGGFANGAVPKTCVDLPETIQVLSGGTSTPAPLTYAAGLNVIDVCFYVGIEESVEDAHVNVFPVPAHLSVTVQSDVYGGSTEFVLYNSLGQEMLRETLLSGNEHINIVALAEGYYFYEIVDAGKNIGRGKLVKE